MKKAYFLQFILLLLFLISQNAHSQFYNGHQMTFGKNRVQYNPIYWQYYRYEDFDTYFYEDGEPLAKYVSHFAKEELQRLETVFEQNLSKRIIFLIYNKQSDFQQSNIGLISGSNETNIGGTRKVINNKVFLYYEGDHVKFRNQITAAISQVLFTEMMNGPSFKDKLANSTIFDIPEWFEKGLIMYASNSYDFVIEDKIKDGILSKKYKKFNRLSGDDAAIAGFSLWRYIEQNFGKSSIANIVYMTKVNKNVEQGFIYTLGLNLKELTELWYENLHQKYTLEEELRDMPSGESMQKRPMKDNLYSQVKISPTGKYITYMTNEMGKYTLWLYNTETQKKKKILSRGNRLDRIQDLSYPLLAWHPNGEILAIITEFKGYIEISLYTLGQKSYLKTFRKATQTHRIFDIEKILDFDYSDNGLFYVVSGIRLGKTDIYVRNIVAGTFERITHDIADDLNPRFVDNSNKIVFASNRLSDSLYVDRSDTTLLASTYDLFVYDYKNKAKKLVRITNTPYFNETNPLEIKKDQYTYLSDRKGIINREMIKIDSSIAFVDTAIHYRTFTDAYTTTNYKRNIYNYDINSQIGNSAEILFQKGKYFLYIDQFDAGRKAFAENIQDTDLRKHLTRKMRERDSLALVEKNKILPKDTVSIETIRKLPHPDSLDIDINNYVFEDEKDIPYHYYYPDTTAQYFNAQIDTNKIVKKRIYQTAFYTNTLASQVDFSFLNSSYQAFSGGEVYFNPGFNMLTKIGALDLFENYKITAGFRFSADFNSNEYLLSVENVKKQWDKQFIFHRQAYSYYDEYLFYQQKVHTHNLYATLSYPFSEVASFSTTLNFRHDRAVLKSADYLSLIEPNIASVWTGAKAQYVFDNSRMMFENIYYGTRFKAFGEYYQSITEKNSSLFILGFDFRNYQKIHRSIIWASRIAASTNFGKSRLVYYLGAVDNWLNLSMETPTFNTDIPIDTEKNYVFQTVATNMRGFTQNIRNGDNFLVLNNEIRWPIIQYLYDRPISSTFFRTLQVIGFFDVGSAWSGLNPWDGESGYSKQVIKEGPITVVIDKNRPPFVYGYGFGIRARLLGYFVRTDWAWGVDDGIILPRIFYLSLNLDF